MPNEKSWTASAIARRAIAMKKLQAVIESKPELDFSQFEYIGGHTKSTVVCLKHGPFQSTPSNLIAGHGCRRCASERSNQQRKLEVATWIERARKAHGDRYDYGSAVFEGTKKNIAIICKDHGPFLQTPDNHAKGHGCHKCAIDSKADNNKVSTEEWIARVRAVHGDKYDYSKAEVNGLRNNVSIVCKDHGLFFQNPGNHGKGHGCPQCGKESSTNTRKSSTDKWREQAKKTHGDVYDYSGTVVDGVTKKVQIVCRMHGAFYQRAEAHVRGARCPKCATLRITDVRKLSMADWVNQARDAHGDKYDYSESILDGTRNKVSIRCKEHGVFQQEAGSHTRGVGCPKCSHHQSKGETEVFNFCKALASDAESRNRKLIAPKEVDIYIPSRKLAIEYCGMYWHASFDPDEEKETKRKHADKHAACKAQGVRLLTIYETEWAERAPQIRRLVRTALGKLRGSVMARKCEVRKVEHKQAKAFYEKYHIQGGNGHGVHYGLYWAGKLVACMRFNEGANDRGAAAATRSWTLGRYATRVAVPGGASRILAAFLADHPEVQQLKSFSDNRYFEGGMYEKLGFRLEEELPPDYMVWHPKLGLLPKPHLQRRNIPVVQQKLDLAPDFDPETDPRTEQQMTYEMEMGRIFDCGKKRWVFDRPDCK